MALRVLVTGGSGQVGRSLAAISADSGPDFSQAVFPRHDELDVTMPDTIASMFDTVMPELVVNCAAFTAVDRAEDEEDQAFAINAAGAGNIAQACARDGVPLIHLSTDYVFDGSKPSPYTEADTPNPVSAYGRSKLAGERLVAENHGWHIILRTAWVHSPYGGNFVKTMLRLATARDTVSVVADQYGTPTYAPHLAAAIIAISQGLSTRQQTTGIWGTYHATGAGETNWADLARAVFQQADHSGLPVASVSDIETRDFPTPADRPANSRLDCALLLTTFGVQLPDWRTGVQACVTALAEDDNAEATT